MCMCGVCVCVCVCVCVRGVHVYMYVCHYSVVPCHWNLATYSLVNDGNFLCASNACSCKNGCVGRLLFQCALQNLQIQPPYTGNDLHIHVHYTHGVNLKEKKYLEGKYTCT